MTPKEYILTKQTLWAKRHGLPLQGSKGDRGRLTYTLSLDANLFRPLSESARADIQQGDGGELFGKNGGIAKMQALHSSSALGVNIFQYWQEAGLVPAIAAACGFCRKDNPCSQAIRFERKFQIDRKFQFSPNLDVVIENRQGSPCAVFAVECKFSEAYSNQGYGGIDAKYLELEIWEDIPHLYALARELSPTDEQNTYLHPAQLVKHILGLKQAYGKSRFRLLYLWYDVIGEAGSLHRQEIARFGAVARQDGVKFHAMSYQEVIVRLAGEYTDEHGDYIHYISGRYL